MECFLQSVYHLLQSSPREGNHLSQNYLSRNPLWDRIQGTWNLLPLHLFCLQSQSPRVEILHFPPNTHLIDLYKDQKTLHQGIRNRLRILSLRHPLHQKMEYYQGQAQPGAQ
uniref:Uncharacterized protein n=1 Tax=Lepeophtheirus salmonis TaxID=72036 RepID=A0A0K2SXM7_LEPSM